MLLVALFFWGGHAQESICFFSFPPPPAGVPSLGWFQRDTNRKSTILSVPYKQAHPCGFEFCGTTTKVVPFGFWTGWNWPRCFARLAQLRDLGFSTDAFSTGGKRRNLGQLFLLSRAPQWGGGRYRRSHNFTTLYRIVLSSKYKLFRASCIMSIYSTWSTQSLHYPCLIGQAAEQTLEPPAHSADIGLSLFSFFLPLFRRPLSLSRSLPLSVSLVSFGAPHTEVGQARRLQVFRWKTRNPF